MVNFMGCGGNSMRGCAGRSLEPAHLVEEHSRVPLSAQESPAASHLCVVLAGHEPGLGVVSRRGRLLLARVEPRLGVRVLPRHKRLVAAGGGADVREPMCVGEVWRRMVNGYPDPCVARRLAPAVSRPPRYRPTRRTPISRCSRARRRSRRRRAARPCPCARPGSGARR